MDEFLADVQKLDVISMQKRRGAKFLKQIKNLSDKLQPCFKALHLIAQSDQWSAMAWGVFRFVLQLAGNFVVFFEKLTKTIGQVAVTLPQYDDYMQVDLGGATERLKSSPYHIYAALFDFFHGVARVFTKQNGSKSMGLADDAYLMTDTTQELKGRL